MIDRYFYINQFEYDPTKTRITRVSGYYTDKWHNFFFPSSGHSREEVIRMLNERTVVFLYDGSYHRLYVKLVKLDQGEFLRVDYHKNPADYMG